MLPLTNTLVRLVCQLESARQAAVYESEPASASYPSSMAPREKSQLKRVRVRVSPSPRLLTL